MLPRMCRVRLSLPVALIISNLEKFGTDTPEERPVVGLCMACKPNRELIQSNLCRWTLDEEPNDND